jgi:hypothetical protein
MFSKLPSEDELLLTSWLIEQPVELPLTVLADPMANKPSLSVTNASDIGRS